MKRYKLAAIVLLTCMMADFVQAKGMIFYNISTKDGLSYSSVRDITQDSYGFIWIASLKGLNRFDGYNIIKYTDDDGSGLDTDVIEALETVGNDILLGTNVGLFRYDTSKERFFRVESESAAMGVGSVTDICRNSSGEVFISSSTGVFKYVGNTLSVFFDSADILKLCCGKNGDLLAIDRETLYQLSPEGTVLKSLSSKEVCGTDDVFTCLSLDDNGTLWLGMMSTGVFQYNLSTSVHNRIVIGDSGVEEMKYVRTLMSDGEGKIWIGTENGLFVYDMTSCSSVHYRKSISSGTESISDNAIYCIYKSREDIIWIGSFFGGVDYINEKSEYFEYILPDDGKRSLAGWATSHILQDRSGRIWFASEDNGISILNPEGNTFRYLNKETKPSLNGNNVHTLAEDQEGNVWIGNFVDGLQRISPDLREKTDISVPDPSIYKLYFVGRDSLLIGAMTGVWMMDTRSMKCTEIAPDVIGGKRVDDIVLDSDGYLWLCLHFEGIAGYDFRTGEVKLFNSAVDDAISSDFVYCVHTGADGLLWFGTNNGGLLQYHDGVFRKFDNDGEFRHRTICSIQEDDFGRLWLSTDNGIYSFDKESGEFRKYHTHNELVSSQFNLCAGRRVNSGEILFGSIKGVVRLSPKILGKNEKLTTRPVIYFSNLFISNRSVRPDDDSRILGESLNGTERISLKHNQNMVELDIIPVIQNDRDKHLLIMKYRLSGVEDAFHSVPVEPLNINYTHLRSGSYVLEVTLEDTDGNTVVSHSLDIEILRHPLASFPMMTVYLILFVSVALLIFRTFKKRNEDRMELNLSEQRLNFFTFISHEFKTPLSIMMSLIDNRNSNNPETLTAGDRGIILKNIKQMQYLIKQLMDFRFLKPGVSDVRRGQLDVVETARSLFSTFTPVFEMKKVENHFTSNVDSFICFQDKDKIIKIFGNLISNAVKNVEDSGLVKFTLDIDRNKLKVTIFNSGSFIPKSQYKSIFQSFFDTSKKGNRHSGIGLTLVSEIVRKLGGSLNIESKEGVGTSFIVEMPVSCSEASEESVLDSNISTEEYEYFVDNIMYDLSPYVSEEVEHNTVQTKKYTILLVEDNVDFNNILSEKLALEYSVIQVFDGKQAQKYLSPDIDMLIADVNLQNVTGFHLCRIIKGNGNTAHIPVILLSKSTSEEEKIVGLECGADAYLEKPFNAQELRIRVNNIFKNKESIKTHFKEIIRLDNISSLNNREEVFIKNLTDFIIDNIQDVNLDVDALAHHMGISRTQLYYKLRSYVNLSVTEFITKIRLSKAEEMLSDTSLRISEISWKAGFNSPGYFSKVFKQSFGKTPKEFRQNK